MSRLLRCLCCGAMLAREDAGPLEPCECPDTTTRVIVSVQHAPSWHLSRFDLATLAEGSISPTITTRLKVSKAK
jgi:hypothetical protein